jgi:hypothetical protein
MRIVAVVIALGGCWTTPAPTTPTAAPARAELTITPTGFGPIDAQSAATLDNLRHLFAGYEVRAINDPALEFHVFDGNEQLLYVVTNDDLSVFNVHATSARVSVSDHPWRVGKPFQDAALLTHCECWGENPTCYRAGEHVAVNFARECGDLTSGDRRVLKALDGLPPQRVIWSPTAFGADEDERGREDLSPDNSSTGGAGGGDDDGD